MHKYCKAYYIKDLRQFPSWSELHQEDKELADETIVYLWNDFTVVKSPVLADQGVIWQNVTPEWQIFCQDTLQFEVPEDVRQTYEQETQGQEAADANKEKSMASGEGV